MKTISDTEIIETSRGRKRLGGLFDENAMLHASNAELLAALKTISAQTCDHGPQEFCPRELARAAIAAASGQ